jgi:hypothetical protein
MKGDGASRLDTKPCFNPFVSRLTRRCTSKTTLCSRVVERGIHCALSARVSARRTVTRHSACRYPASLSGLCSDPLSSKGLYEVTDLDPEDTYRDGVVVSLLVVNYDFHFVGFVDGHLKFLVPLVGPRRMRSGKLGSFNLD